MTAQVIGAVPPVEARVAPRVGGAVLTAGRDPVVTSRVGPLTEIDSFALAVNGVGAWSRSRSP